MEVLVSVMDRGTGVAEDRLEVVMQPSYRLEPSRNRETGGTGLGLAMAQQLAATIGGSVRLHNRDVGGLGAEVSIFWRRSSEYSEMPVMRDACRSIVTLRYTSGDFGNIANMSASQTRLHDHVASATSWKSFP